MNLECNRQTRSENFPVCVPISSRPFPLKRRHHHKVEVKHRRFLNGRGLRQWIELVHEVWWRVEPPRLHRGSGEGHDRLPVLSEEQNYRTSLREQFVASSATPELPKNSRSKGSNILSKAEEHRISFIGVVAVFFLPLTRIFRTLFLRHLSPFWRYCGDQGSGRHSGCSCGSPSARLLSQPLWVEREEQKKKIQKIEHQRRLTIDRLHQ